MVVAEAENKEKALSSPLKCYARKVAGSRIVVRLPESIGGGSLMVYASFLSDLIAGKISECWFVLLPDSEEWKIKKKNR
jgi:hypothetical protein